MSMTGITWLMPASGKTAAALWRNFASVLAGNVGFLLEAGGEPFEAVGERHELVAAARLIAQVFRDAAQGCGDAAEIRYPIFWRVLVHRVTAIPTSPANAPEMPTSARATESCADFLPACGFISSRG